jgi:hypothetical protein
VGLAIALYGICTVVAIACQRHLYGDAVWYLVRVLSENQVVVLDAGFGKEFFRSRWFAYHLTQWPLLWASQLGMTSLTGLSWIFGAALFLPRTLSLIACWVWLKDKRLFLFPLASLFAGSMNAEIYIVSEAHFLLSLVWPLLILLWCAELTPARRVWLLLIAIPTLLAYETMAFFGPLLAAAAVLRAIALWDRVRDRILCLVLAAYFALGSLFAVMATVWPRDAANRGTFVSGLVMALERGHLGILASIWLTLTFPVVAYLWPRSRRLSAVLLAAPLLLGGFYVIRLFAQPEQVGFETHMYARGMTVVTPWPLCLMFLLLPIVSLSWRPMLLPCLRAVAVFGLLQCVWSLGATMLWTNMVTALRLELARSTGVVPYESTVLARRTLRGMPMDRLHMTWPLLPMSIVLGGSLDVSSVVFAERYPFAPFNPYMPAELPNLSRFGVRYTRLAATLDDGAHLDFRAGGNATASLGEGWSNRAEDWASWTDGTRATIRLRTPRGIERGSALQMRLGAFVVRQHPRQRVTVSLNGQRLGALEITEAQVADGPAAIELPIPAGVAAAGGAPLVVQLDLPDAQSPKSLGLSGDPRQLGIAMVALSITPNASAPAAASSGAAGGPNR